MKLFVYLCWCFLLILQAFAAKGELFNQVAIDLKPEIGEIKFYQQGVRVVSFSLKNHSSESKDVEITVLLGGLIGNNSVSRKITVAPQGFINTDLSLPVLDTYNYDLKIIVDGEAFDPKKINLNRSTLIHGDKSKFLDILLSEPIITPINANDRKVTNINEPHCTTIIRTDATFSVNRESSVVYIGKQIPVGEGWSLNP